MSESLQFSPHTDAHRSHIDWRYAVASTMLLLTLSRANDVYAPADNFSPVPMAQLMPDSTVIEAVHIGELDDATPINISHSDVKIPPLEKKHIVGLIDTGAESDNIIAEACFISNPRGLDVPLCPNGLHEQTGKGAAAPLKGVKGEHGQLESDYIEDKIPEAAQIHVQYLTETKDGKISGSYDDLEKGLLFISDYQTKNPNIQVDAIVIASGGGAYTDRAQCSNDTLDPILKKLADQNIKVVAAAGNDGKVGIAYPACNPNIIPIGATKYDTVSSSQQYGPYSNIDDGISAFDPLFKWKGMTFGGTSLAAVDAAHGVVIANKDKKRFMTKAETEQYFTERGRVLPTVREGRNFNPIRVMVDKDWHVYLPIAPTKQKR